MRTKSVEVEPAKEIDLSILLEIYNSSRASAGCCFEKALDIERFSALIDGERIHVAVLDGAVVGFASVWAADRFIHHLYVSPQYQGCGIGSSLLETCAEIYGLPLSLKCDTSNEHAQRFYRRKGWLPSERGVGADGPWERFESPSA
ncbi:GNAT family N-acetyltransferase [Thiohalobacter thiocyanaticus]|uniref:N-acetyltransferase n=1 Tax=Thiohalobacter thiocyanaticus TaxID=585455 RepID=A0A426QE05_9GAMM|nr:N-acetyltransferase [Thiohalobacter thiocyanaticus]